MWEATFRLHYREADALRLLDGTTHVHVVSVGAKLFFFFFIFFFFGIIQEWGQS